MKWYKCNVCDVDAAAREKTIALMGSERFARLSCLKEEDRARSIAGEYLARCAISAWCNISPNEVLFEYSDMGKPIAHGLDVQFSISHSADIAVCAVSDTPVGIDIERIREIDLKLARRICTDCELHYIMEERQTERFFEIWTIKEAHAKMLGGGISMIREKIDYENLRITKPEIEGYALAIVNKS